MNSKTKKPEKKMTLRQKIKEIIVSHSLIDVGAGDTFKEVYHRVVNGEVKDLEALFKNEMKRVIGEDEDNEVCSIKASDKEMCENLTEIKKFIRNEFRQEQRKKANL